MEEKVLTIHPARLISIRQALGKTKKTRRNLSSPKVLSGVDSIDERHASRTRPLNHSRKAAPVLLGNISSRPLYGNVPERAPRTFVRPHYLGRPAIAGLFFVGRCPGLGAGFIIVPILLCAFFPLARLVLDLLNLLRRFHFSTSTTSASIIGSSLGFSPSPICFSISMRRD